LAELKPTWFLGENVVALDRGELDTVVSDLEGLGYEVAPTLEVPACAFGLDHWRARYWILGHANRNGEPGVPIHAEVARMPRSDRDAAGVGETPRLSGRLDGHRLSALGNAVAPQIPEWIGRHLMELAREEEVA
jgi:DNA (cytosine-5)-methyltransferase 1